MSAIRDLLPGDVVRSPVSSATFVVAADHPLYPGLQLVVWRMADGSWLHDALRADQEVGEVTSASPEDRTESLRAALHG